MFEEIIEGYKTVIRAKNLLFCDNKKEILVMLAIKHNTSTNDLLAIDVVYDEATLREEYFKGTLFIFNA